MIQTSLFKNVQLESVLRNFMHLFNFHCSEKVQEFFLSGKW